MRLCLSQVPPLISRTPIMYILSPCLVLRPNRAECCSSSSARSETNAACPLPGAALAMILSYSSRSLVSIRLLSSIPTGMKYSARRIVKAKFTVPSVW